MSAEYYRLWRMANPEKVKATQQRWRDRHPQQIKDGNRLRHHGLLPEQYQSMLLIQGYRCAICYRPEKATFRGQIKDLAVDHDHLTGRVRGLLCANCNRAVGLLQDDPEIAERVRNYLRRYS